MNISFYDFGNNVITHWKNVQYIPNANDNVVLDNPKTNAKEVWCIREKLVFPNRIKCLCYKTMYYYDSNFDDEDLNF